MTTGPIGTRVAALRKTRGFTQRELARRAAISYSLLTKVESGHAPATPAVIGALARALRVDVPRVTGQPYEDESRTGGAARLRASVEPIRLALNIGDLPVEDMPPRTLTQLSADVAQVSALGRVADYAAIGASLPTLLADLSIALHQASDSSRPRLYALLAEAYSGASSIATLLGHLDLRDRVVDRIEEAALLCDDPLRPQRARWQRSASLMAASAYQAALGLMERTRRELGEDPAAMDAATRSVYGSLHLRSAVIAARAAATEGASRASQAWQHIEAAREVAVIAGGDRDDYGLAFGPSNVAQHAVSIAVELEDADRAITLGRTTRLSATVPAVRRGHHHLDLARAHLMSGDPRGSLKQLTQARRIAPQQTRHHPMARETMLAILDRTRATNDTATFARWLGIA